MLYISTASVPKCFENEAVPCKCPNIHTGKMKICKMRETCDITGKRGGGCFKNKNPCKKIKNGGCHVHSTCTPTENWEDVLCKCWEGYEGDGKTTCVDIPECKALGDKTINIPCRCPQGKTQTWETCKDGEFCDYTAHYAGCAKIKKCHDEKNTVPCNCANKPADATEMCMIFETCDLLSTKGGGGCVKKSNPCEENPNTCGKNSVCTTTEDWEDFECDILGAKPDDLSISLEVDVGTTESNKGLFGSDFMVMAFIGSALSFVGGYYFSKKKRSFTIEQPLVQDYRVEMYSEYTE